MKINKLVLYNFSSFEDKNEFDFTINDDEKNIILIGGQNGAGKTSLFSAIKLALYGPLAFGYMGTNSYYVQKIKEYINSKAFQKETVEAGVTIEISVKVEREIKTFEIERKWNYAKQKITEIHSVKQEGKTLDEQELSYFENYLKMIIPPDLFEFFLFDGEEVGSVFSTNNYNGYVKNALFTMCEMDVFEIIRKYSANYIAKSSGEEDEGITDRYNVNEQEIIEFTELIEDDEIKKNELSQTVGDLQIELEELEVAYKNAGGITEMDRIKLNNDLDRFEKVKVESNLRIKVFVEGLMPFFIVKDLIQPISTQLDNEERGEIYQYVQFKLEKKDIQNTLDKHGVVKEEAIDELIEVLLSKFKPKGYSEDIQPIHELSKEEINRVNTIFSSLEELDVASMLMMISEKQIASEKTREINAKLKSTMGEDDANKFSEKENRLLKQIASSKDNMILIEKELEANKSKLEKIKSEQAKLYQSIIENAQNKHIYELSNSVSKIMQGLLEQKTVAIKNELENMTVDNLQSIYRKNNLITRIEIDDDFKLNLYQNETYNEMELVSLMRNYGNEEFKKLIGIKGTELLLDYYGLSSISEVLKYLSENWSGIQIDLFKKIELSRLSKGERQIFILSLYWAIIKLSGQDIPFIIDTPYARIDANHRREISEKFFPNISKQVIILSTDEEINEEYYKIVKPFIAKEYLLTNNESENRTTVENKYFYEV